LPEQPWATLYAHYAEQVALKNLLRHRLHKSFSTKKEKEEANVYFRRSRNIRRRFNLKIEVGVTEALGAAAGAGVGVDVVVVLTPKYSLIASPAPSSIAATTAPIASLSVGNPAAAHPARVAITAAKNTAIACLLSLNPLELLIFIFSIIVLLIFA
jgi:hypothetical protein